MAIFLPDGIVNDILFKIFLPSVYWNMTSSNVTVDVLVESCRAGAPDSVWENKQKIQNQETSRYTTYWGINYNSGSFIYNRCHIWAPYYLVFLLVILFVYCTDMGFGTFAKHVLEVILLW